jgi:DNA-binding transcriptional ArsR family regulator
MSAEKPVALDRVFHALSDATRRAVIDRLHAGPASVSDLATPLDMALPSVMKHLGVLEKAGLVRSDKTGRVRTYQMTPGALATVERWVASRRALWNRNLDRLGDFLKDDAFAEEITTAPGAPRRLLPHRHRGRR